MMNLLEQVPFLVKYIHSNIETYHFPATFIFSINNFVTTMLIAWYGLELIPTRSYNPLKNLSNQIVWVMHITSTVFLLWSFPNKSTSNTILMDDSQTVENLIKSFWSCPIVQMRSDFIGIGSSLTCPPPLPLTTGPWPCEEPKMGMMAPLQCIYTLSHFSWPLT